MALAGITDGNTELSALLGASAFAANTTKQNVQERLRPNQVENLQKNDFVSLSAKALQLSRDALANSRTDTVK